MKVRQFLFLQRSAPSGAEDFDLALTAAAFDQETRLILLDDAVYWLSRGLPDLLEQSVDDIMVEEESLIERGLDHKVAGQVLLVSRAALGAMIAAADQVVSG